MLLRLLTLASVLVVVGACDGPQLASEVAREGRGFVGKDLGDREWPASTVVTPYLERPMEAGRNMIWCATFQMAWDRLKRLSGGAVRTVPGASIVSRLNQERIKADVLPRGHAIVCAGLVQEGIVQEIKRARRRIPGLSGRPLLISRKRNLPPDYFIVYALLARSLRFEKPFASLRGMSIRGSSTKAGCFGIREYSASNPTKRMQADQVRVLWHTFRRNNGTWSAQSFVVELLTSERQDRLLLAKIQPRSTLRKTIDRVVKLARYPNSKRPKGKPLVREVKKLKEGAAQARKEGSVDRWMASLSKYSCLLFDEDVRIPKIELGVTRHFPELVGQRVVSNNEKIDGKPIEYAAQRIRFELNEKGAELESEAAAGLFGRLGIRDFSFNPPFLVLLMRRSKQRPYFALWVANGELLVEAEDEAAR